MSLVFWTERWKLAKTPAPSNQVTDPICFLLDTIGWKHFQATIIGHCIAMPQFLPFNFLLCSSILQFLGLALVKALRQTPDAVET